jgi:hypothetical protein
VNNTHALDASDLDTSQSTTELYKLQGKVSGEKSFQSGSTTAKSTTSRNIAPTTNLSKKATQNSSNAGGHKNPPHDKIDISHKLPMRKKRKNVVGKTKDPKTEIENTPRDQLITIKNFRDTTYTRNSRGPNYFVLGRRGQENPSLQEKTSRSQGARAIPKVQITMFWVEGDE